MVGQVKEEYLREKFMRDIQIITRKQNIYGVKPVNFSCSQACKLE